MTLTVQCTCGKTYPVDESLAGRRVKCKACGGALIVPQKPAAAAPVAADEDEFRMAPLDTPQRAAAPIAKAAPGSPAAVAAVAKAPPAAHTAKSPAASAPAPTSALPFFLAVSIGWSKSLIYRVYVDRDALLLMDVSPYNVLVDLEVARRADGSHWAVKTVESLKAWVLGAGAVLFGVLGMLGIGIARAGFQKPQEALQLVSFLVTIAAIVIPFLILLATWTMRVIVRRSQQLDALSADDLRREAAAGGDKYRFAPGELSAGAIKPPFSPGPATKQLAEVTFKHSSGSWKLLLFTTLDTRVAISAFRRLLGREVEVDSALE